MTMATVSVMLKVDNHDVVRTLRQSCEQLKSGDGQLIVDFSALRRIDPQVLSAMRDLTARAEANSVKLTLRGVNIEVYKVLTLLKLASRFSYLD